MKTSVDSREVILLQIPILMQIRAFENVKMGTRSAVYDNNTAFDNIRVVSSMMK